MATSDVSQDDVDHHELHFSDSDGEDDAPVVGDYSSRMEEIMDEGDEEGEASFRLDSDDEEDFLYTGVDSESTAALGYQDRLREVLEQDSDEESEGAIATDAPKVVVEGDSQQLAEVQLGSKPSASPTTSTSSSPRTLTPVQRKISSKLARPFLHPTVSRLRSHSPHTSTPNTETSFFNSPSSSQFSHSISRVSSFSNSQQTSSSRERGQEYREVVDAAIHSIERDVFKWSDLHMITQEVYLRSRKAMTVLGSQKFETPTVLAANGYICIGTSDGKILVYDFRQKLKCICGDDSSENHVGSVTALALSNDHTCVAAGYSTGHIQIYNLQNPTTPIRSVPPTALASVYSGRKEGHIHGSRIVNIGFVAGRHTAVVSADVQGLAFYHSLGKVLFVEASDILRILGRYPDLPPPAHPQDPRTSEPKYRNPRYTILAMAPLPLGTSPHVTDHYNLVSMLTPTKLVLVGLKPNPKTWFKIPRGLEEGGMWRSQTRWKGTMAWFPSMFQESGAITNGKGKKKGKGKGEEAMGTPTPPILAFSWGNTLRFIRIQEVKIKQAFKNAKTGKVRETEVGAITFQDVVSWTAEEEILAIQWLNAQQLVILTPSQMGVFDLQTSNLIEQVPFEASNLMFPTVAYMRSGNTHYPDSVRDVSHSLRTYKGKIFLLGGNDVRVGTLLTWADRILSLVEDGDFLSAIELARSYYLDEAPGNRNGLPIDPQRRKEIIGEKLRDLMVASTRYAFSEERMTDSTHVTPDNRGVDRTTLFESLVTTCCHACIALDDTEFLFEELFQKYDDSGISAMYLRHLEPFMLNNEIRYVPPRITQRLISLHEEDDRPDLVERVIWHIDPACLDINQAIHLCQKHHLYDALIYVYTRALRDYVAPIVELLGLIRRVLIQRRTKAENAINEADSDYLDPESRLEPMIMNSYKAYPYLSHVLSGLTYPSGEPLPEDEAFQAKKDIYTFLFYGRSSVWPPGEGGKLILTSDEEGGVEPTYPYIRQLLQWDAEAFLHSLDIAFEDTFLNDESQSINRLIIVRILIELITSDSLSREDAIFVDIFIARNVPKYPQFLRVAPSVLHKTLVHLATGGTPETREDRQLAAEYLLSVYTHHDDEKIISLFKSAGFYRILRSWHRQDQRWDPLFMTYLDDSTVHLSTAFEQLDEVLATATRANRGVLPPQLAATAENSLGRLLQAGISETALLLQKHLPHLHDQAIKALDDADDRRFIYLQALLSPANFGDNVLSQQNHSSIPSSPSSPDLRRMFIDLQCRFRPQDTATVLESLPSNFLQWDEIIRICETNEVYDAVIWAYDSQGDPQVALDKAADFQRQLALQVVQSFQESDNSNTGTEQALMSLRTIGQMGIDICLRRSRKSSDVDVPLEDIWFTLLNSQINVVQLVSACQSPSNSGPAAETMAEHLSGLRSLVQNTFSALVSITSTSAVSFPRLFKRLANSTTSTVNPHYDEFRTILTGMLESYRSDGDMLTMTRHLVERDLFGTIADFTRQKTRGWTLDRGICTECRQPLSKEPPGQVPDEANASILQIVVVRTGKAYHSKCRAD